MLVFLPVLVAAGCLAEVTDNGDVLAFLEEREYAGLRTGYLVVGGNTARFGLFVTGHIEANEFCGYSVLVRGADYLIACEVDCLENNQHIVILCF